MQKTGTAIAELLQTRNHLLSVEFFPPKNEEGARQILRTAKNLQAHRPDFVSITYGAGGGTRERTLAYGELLKDIFDYEVMPHLTCVGHSRDELAGIIEGFQQRGFRNIMALRGDPPKGQKDFEPHPDGLRYGSELVAFINERFPDFCLGVGGYPEKHPDAASVEDDLHWLKHKVEQGATFITTQLFFDNADFYAWQDKARALGITAPIIPGILPALSSGQLERLTQFCDARVPLALSERLAAVKNDPVASRQVGIDWAYEQVRDLLEQGAPGVHLYIMNRSESAIELIKRLRHNGLLQR